MPGPAPFSFLVRRSVHRRSPPARAESMARTQHGASIASSAGTAPDQATIADILTRPARPPHVELVGEMQESGFKERQWLARRDGRYIQLTEPLYRVLEYSDGSRSISQIAEAVTENSPWVVSDDVVQHIILTKLLPLGLIGHRQDRRTRTNTALTVNLRIKMLQPRHIEPLTGVLRRLYTPWLLIPLLILVAAGHLWMYLVHGVGRGIHQAFYTPGLLLVIFALLLISIIVHEFGHAAALRYGGGRVGGMGVGFYLMYPAFYTDTTDSYRLGRWDRVRTDLGGFYFHLIFALGMIVLAAATRQDFLLFVAVLINADLVRQLLPFARFDGYWALVDLTGMPDFFSQMKPFLLGLLPGRTQRARMPALKGWVKSVFLAYTLVTIPLLIVLLGWTLTRLPTLAAILSGSLRQQAAFAAAALHHDNRIVLAASVVQILLLCFEVVGLTHLLYVSVARPLLGVWNRINPLPPTRRAATVTTAAALCLGTVLAFPQVLYTPGRLASAVLTRPAHAQVSSAAPSSTGPERHAGVPSAPPWSGAMSSTASSLPATSAVLTLPARQTSHVLGASSRGRATASIKSCLNLLRTKHTYKVRRHAALSAGGK